MSGYCEPSMFMWPIYLLKLDSLKPGIDLQYNSIGSCSKEFTDKIDKALTIQERTLYE